MRTRRNNIMIGGGVAALAALGAGYAAYRQMGSMAAYDAKVAAARAEPSAPAGLRGLVQLASLAPSGHNTQPWRFITSESRLDIRPDFTRRTPIVDPDDHHLFVSLGCAGENLAIAAAEHGRPGVLRFDPAGEGGIAFEFERGSSARSELYPAIARRQSTRAEYDGTLVPAADLRQLVAVAAIPGVDLVLVTDRSRINQLRDLVRVGNDMQMADPAFLRELKSWLRFNPREASLRGDGLFSAASGNPSLPNWLGPVFFDLAFNAAAENKRYARHIDSSAGLAIFSAHEAGPEGWVQVGRSCQRFALKATALGLKTAFANQPVEVAALRPELASMIGLPGRRPDLVMRFGRGPELPFSPRRSLEEILGR